VFKYILPVVFCAIFLLADEFREWDFFDKNGAVMLLIEPQSGRIKRANQSAGEFYGHPVDKLETMYIQDINTFTPEQIKEERLRALGEDRNYFLFRHRLANGDIRRVEVYSHPVQVDGQVFLFSIIHDVTNEELAKQTVDSYGKLLEEQVDIRTREVIEREEAIRYIIIAALVFQTLIIILLAYNIKKRKAAQDELKGLLASLEERIRVEVEKTRKQDIIIYEQSKSRALNELLINIAHHWRQPLNIICLQAEGIGDVLDYEGGDRDKIDRNIAMIVDESKKLSQAIKLLYSGFSGDANEKVNLLATFELAEYLIEASYQEANIILSKDIDKSINLNIKEADLLDIIVTLLYNVYEIANSRGLKKVNLHIKGYEEEDAIYIVFSDDAGGFDAKLMPDRMFEPYVTTHFKSRQKGLGLYIVKSVAVNRLGGEVWAENIDGGARITIKVYK